MGWERRPVCRAGNLTTFTCRFSSHLGALISWNPRDLYRIYITETLWPECRFNPLNTELNPVCHLLTLLGAHHILHVSRIRVNDAISIKNLNGKS